MGSIGRKNLVLISKCLSNNSQFWHTDNFTASKIVESGSSKSEAVKKKLFMSAYEKYKPQISLKISTALAGEQCRNLQSAMTTSKNSPFKPIIEKWNTMAADYFVYYKISKSSRFN